ncbi:MAG: flagellar biosynthesis protein FlhB [Phycisphaerae bacterium]|nr:flagellar biosynthesis protein FlhB [Phycisphaerae bacterium]
MAEDLGERTEQPTERRLEEAREKGQVARSTDLSAAVVLTAVVAAALMFAEYSLGGMATVLRHSLSDESLGNGQSVSRLMPEMMASFGEAARVAVPVMSFLVVIGLIGALAQVGWRLSPAALEPKWNKLNVLTGFKNLLGKRALVKGGLDLLKFSLVAAVVGLVVSGQHREILALANLDVMQGVARAAGLVRELALWVLVILVSLGVVDFLYQRWQHRTDLRMTKHEVKEERRSNEGDAEMKGRRMRIARQVAMQRLGAAVPRADVVVTNPTHYAVALKYDAESGAKAPKVVAKGADYLALKMRYLAAGAGVPIVERPPLARALYHEVGVGKEIHPAHYEAVAEVLAYVYRLERRAAG